MIPTLIYSIIVIESERNIKINTTSFYRSYIINLTHKDTEDNVSDKIVIYIIFT